jgi:hypothetical protein
MRSRHSFLVAVLLGGAIAGIVDIGAASAINGFVDPLRITRFIAGGLIGLPAAKAGGLGASALGFALQVAMSVLIAAIYNTGAALLPMLKRHWLPAGLAFGVGVYFVMEYVVVPNSKIGHAPPLALDMSLLLNMIAMLVFGTIIAWFARAEGR